MKLTWYGHSCFLMETEGGSIVFDPYSPGSVPGLKLPELTADMVICSHEHADHFFPQGVRLTGRDPAVGIQRVPTFHDGAGGKMRGGNMVTLIDAEGIRAAHLGDLGHTLTQDQIDELGRVDVLMVPVGGFFTIDAAAAWELTERINPHIVIPMHYRGEGFGFDMLATVDGFLARAERVTYLDGNVIQPDLSAPPMTAVLKCPVRPGAA